MNLKDYIESGILEAYALNDLSTGQRLEVEKKLTEHPQLRIELDKIESTMEALLIQAGVAPSSSARQRVISSIDAPSKTPLGGSASLWFYATAASLVVAVASSVLAIVFWSNWKRTETDLNERIALTQRMAEDFDVVRQRINKIEGDLQIYDHPSYHKVVLKGTSAAPDALATVYWNPFSTEAYISLQNLKELTTQQQYQLWAIVDGKPVDMGVFDGAVTGLIKMKNITKASAFAVTIEPRGGSQAPTLSKMQVIGEA